MGKRFSRLKYALELLRPLDDEDAEVTAPTGTALEKFQQYRAGQTVLTYDIPESSNPGSLKPIGIHAFTKPFVTDAPIRTLVSNRADTTEAMNAIKAVCGLQAANIPPEAPRSFIPAKVTVTVTGEGDPTTETSQITGLAYEKPDVNSYTLPYGKTAAEDVEEVRRTAIVAAAVAGQSLTFSSEKL